MLQTGRSGSIPDEAIEFLSVYLIIPAALDRNEYQKQKNKCFLESEARPVREADILSATVGSLTSHNPIGLHGLLRG
jgi:hypothetical protein